MEGSSESIRRNIIIAGTAAVSFSAVAGYFLFSAINKEGLTLTSLDELQAYSSRSSWGRISRTWLGPHVHVVKIINQKNFIEVPPVLSTFKALTEVNLSGNSLTNVPSSLFSLNKLKKLSLGRNQLNDIPPDIGLLNNLEDLDIGRNQLTSLPSEIGRLKNLKFLNVMANNLSSVPEELGNLSNLYRLGLKSNKLKGLPESIGNLKSLVELFITDNLLEALPSGMGGMDNLVKLQASFNKLKVLPDEMGRLPKLELLRVAVNELTEIPTSFSQLNTLAWFSIAGNPVCPPPPPGHRGIEKLDFSKLVLGEKLGDGASGDVFAAIWQGKNVAFKQFKAETSPDGHCRDEIAITCAVDHPQLSRVLATVDEPHGIVMELLSGLPMAEKPNFEFLLRCRWPKGEEYELTYVLRVATCLAGALGYLHSRGICHGDVYAHNCLASRDGNCVLVDYGASFCYLPGDVPFEAHEVRAFGLLLNDLVQRVPPAIVSAQLKALTDLVALVAECTEVEAIKRILFSDVVFKLAAISAGLAKDS